MLASLARRLSRQRGWGAHLVALEWRQSTLLSGETGGLRQAAGLAAAAGGGSSSGSDAKGKRRGSSRGKGGGPRAKPAATADAEGAQPMTKPPQPASAQQLEALLGRFKVHARGNDAARAEHFYRAYIQAGGAPQHWMLPMLLGTYGRLRQADKAWAIYRQLVPDPRQAQQAQQGSTPAAQTPGAAGSARAAATGAALKRSAAVPAAAAAPAFAAADDTGASQGRELEGEHHAWEGRLAARRRELDSTAAQLVKELRLDTLPLTEYGYGALLTALSRAEHPPYDLPAHYADKAAQAFEEMRAAGVEPNVVLWHNLLDCQAKAGQPDAAFATYRRMLVAGAAPNSWTFSMLVSACGRARQPGRASDVVERLMPQAGVAPSLTVWNSLLGAYGRAGSVDAAYATWLRMLESGTTPDDCTERSLALAFGSHPALAGDVVAEARQIRQQRAAEGGLEGAAAGAAAEAQGGGGGGEEEAGAAGAADGSTGKRAPYRLHQHRQGSLAVDQTDHASRRSQRRNPALGLLLSRGLPGAGAAGGAAADASGTGSAAAAEGGAGGEEAEGQGLQLRQLLVLDLHGSSQAAARMVLLRRLEALVVHAGELFAEMERLEQEHYRRQEWQQQLAQARRRKKEASRALLRDMRDGSGGGSRSSGSSGSSGMVDGSSGSGSSLEENSSQGAGLLEGEAALNSQQQQQQEVHQRQEQRQPECPAFGQSWGSSASSTWSPADPLAGSGAAGGEQSALQGQQDAAARPRGRRFLPPALNIITGVGRHSKGGRGGVLKAAVKQTLEQQGLSTLDDPTNEGVVLVPWPVLAAYLEQQRDAMDTDHFFSAARMRYLYVLSGVAGLAAAANLLPRLAPWLPS